MWVIRWSVLGNNAADGCDFSDYGLTLFSHLRKILFLSNLEGRSIICSQIHLKEMRCCSEWPYSGEGELV